MGNALFARVTASEIEATARTVVRLVRKIEQQHGGKCALVVVDTLARAFAGGNENDNRDMGGFVKNVDRIRRALGTAVLIVHHAGKNAAAGARGHSSLRAATDTEIEIVNGTDGSREIRITKQRDLEAGPPIRFALLPTELGQDDEGDTVATCTVALEGEADFEFATADRNADQTEQRERNKVSIAELLIATMPADRVSVTSLIPAVMAHAKCGKSKAREMILEAVPATEEGRAVVHHGTPYFIRLEKVGEHKTAQTFVVKNRAVAATVH